MTYKYSPTDNLTEVEAAIKELEIQIRAARLVTNEAKREAMLKQAHSYVKQLLDRLDELEFERLVMEEREKNRTK